jgi:hypothetical protein
MATPDIFSQDVPHTQPPPAPQQFDLERFLNGHRKLSQAEIHAADAQLEAQRIAWSRSHLISGNYSTPKRAA